MKWQGAGRFKGKAIKALLLILGIGLVAGAGLGIKQLWLLVKERQELVNEVELAKGKIVSLSVELDQLRERVDYEQASELEVVIEQNEEKESEKKQVVAKESNQLPGGEYSRQLVKTDRGDFLVSLVVVDGNGIRVVVDTAGDEDCSNDCPVLSLGDYVSRNGGFAGINGGYFCPADYARCEGKTRSFDTLVMRTKDKKVFNRDNNVWSTVPLVVMEGGSLRFYSQTLEWGIDQGKSGALANFPMLVKGGKMVVNEGDLDEKQGAVRGPRGFIGKKGSLVIIGHVHAATVGEAAKAVESLGIEEALNLDGGGSSALWHEGYKVGPGRDLPVAIVLVK